MEIIIIFILILLNGFFALSEIALVSVKKTKIEQRASEGSKSAMAVLKLLEKPENFLSSVQVGITLIGIVAGAYGAAALSDDMQRYLSSFHFLGPYVDEISLVIVIGGITYFSIVVGELVPKSIALKNAERIVLIIAPVIKYFSFITYPFVRLLSLSTRIILSLLRIKPIDEKVSEDDLILMLKTAGSQGVLETEEAQLHHNLFFFADQTAKSMMTYASEVEWIDCNNQKDVVLRKIRESVHSKFVASKGSLNNIKGVISIKDFLENYDRQDFSFDKIITKPLFIHQSYNVFKILNLFKVKKQYFAIVVDEFGKMKGIITLHDIFEGIIGNLPDENEADETYIIKRSDGSYLLDGRTLIYEINQYFQRQVIKDNLAKYTTISGFILENLKSIPKSGDKVIVGNLKFEVVDMDGVRMDKILMTELSFPNV